jgi:hypothetical protein
VHLLPRQRAGCAVAPGGEGGLRAVRRHLSQGRLDPRGPGHHRRVAGPWPLGRAAHLYYAPGAAAAQVLPQILTPGLVIEAISPPTAPRSST